ncbi:hypothetical protein K8Q98_01885 [Candidatus Nomurabacteria bacterium]|nr:hypothetical protein [Candidatus Nomurabacteria bacterium]
MEEQPQKSRIETESEKIGRIQARLFAIDLALANISNTWTEEGRKTKNKLEEEKRGLEVELGVNKTLGDTF